MRTHKYKEMTGNVYEQLTCDHLVKLGYKILNRNYVTYYGEVDIIALKDSVIHFIEVKSLTIGAVTFLPEDSVDEKKMKKILQSARKYLRDLKEKYDIDLRYMDVSFDVASIRHSENNDKIFFRFIPNYPRFDENTLKVLILE